MTCLSSFVSVGDEAQPASVTSPLARVPAPVPVLPSLAAAATHAITTSVSTTPGNKNLLRVICQTLLTASQQ